MLRDVCIYLLYFYQLFSVFFGKKVILRLENKTSHAMLS